MSDGNGFSKLPHYDIDHNVLKTSEFTVYQVLRRHRGANQTAFPSQETIAKKTNLSLRTVKSTLVKLRDMGLIWWQQKEGSNVNEYWLLEYEVWHKNIYGAGKP